MFVKFESEVKFTINGRLQSLKQSRAKGEAEKATTKDRRMAVEKKDKG